MTTNSSGRAIIKASQRSLKPAQMIVGIRWRTERMVGEVKLVQGCQLGSPHARAFLMYDNQALAGPPKVVVCFRLFPLTVGSLHVNLYHNLHYPNPNKAG